MICDDVREKLHEAHDDGKVFGLSDAVREHLDACPSCREFHDDLDTLSQALRAMPLAPLPPDALEAVWHKTLLARRGVPTRTKGFWQLAAAAVLVTAFSATTLYFVFSPVRPPEPSVVELARASAQAEMVFGYTARALAATRSAAADRVLASKVSPAVRGLAASHPARRKS